jgi:FkbM family methyltransferase
MKKLISPNLVLNVCKLINRLKKKCAFFEAGANDGLAQSNTLILEKKLNWSGILVEPLPHLFSKLAINRPNCELFHFALVDKNLLNRKEIEMSYGFSNNDLMSHVNTYQKSFFSFSKHKTIKVPVTTIDNLLKNSKIKQIDFLSLDVEGYEINVLEGMNFKKCSPYAILVEVWLDNIFQIIDFFLERKYYLLDNFSRFNYINNPNWSGKHQDFLFLREDFIKYYKNNI